MSRLLDITDLVYEMLRDGREHRRLLLEERELEREQSLYMEFDFGWDFQDDMR